MLNHITFTRVTGSKFGTTTAHHLYISKDDGLGRYKVQTNEDAISKQEFSFLNMILIII
jgi:hypothetical protein